MNTVYDCAQFVDGTDKQYTMILYKPGEARDLPVMMHGNVTSLGEITPRHFSFNSPQGACPVCDGLGTESVFDPALLIPDGSAPLEEMPVMPWRRSSPALAKLYRGQLSALARTTSPPRPPTEIGSGTAVRAGLSRSASSDRRARRDAENPPEGNVAFEIASAVEIRSVPA